MTKIDFTKCFIVAVITFSSFSCNYKTDKWYFEEVGTLLWVNETMPDSVIKTAVKETLENSTLVVSQISWSPTDRSFMNNVEWYHRLAVESGKTFMMNIDWLENDRYGTIGNWSFEDDNIKKQFSQDIMELVDIYKPDYLSLGVEVNYYALTSPTGYKEYIELFNNLKSTLKKSHPKTRIGLTFQLELLYGLHIDWHNTRALEPLNAVVENLDYIGISTYPDVLLPVENKPFYSAGYLDSLKITYSKPIGISETAISSLNFDSDDRFKYTEYIYYKFKSLDLKFIIWGSILDDPKGLNWKDYLGLICSDGSRKPEFTLWKDYNSKIRNNTEWSFAY